MHSNKPWVCACPKVKVLQNLYPLVTEDSCRGHRDTGYFHPESHVRSTLYNGTFLEELLESQSHNNNTNE